MRVRLHHRGRRLGRLGHGPPAVGQERQQGAAVRGRPGHAAGQGAARDRRQLFRHGLLRPALPLDRAQGPHPGRVAQQSAGEPAAAAQVRAGARAGRRLVDQRPDGQSRRADRLRRMGEAAAPTAGAGTTCCPTSRRSSATSISTGRSTARTAASRCAASRPSIGPATPRRWPKASRPRVSSSCPTRTASSSRATSRSPTPTPTSGACRRRWAISTPRRASAPTSRSRPTRR